jgi:phospholipid/cholesterol/gamma-HCH transport system substrate-binding protein
MKHFTKEIQIALVAIVGVVVLFFGMQFLKGLSLFNTDNSYYVAFNDISGLGASSPVYANGYKVGVIKKIIYDYNHQDNIVAVMGLDKQMQLPKGSTAEIESDMLGNIKVNLVLGKNPLEQMEPGDTLKGGMASGAMAKVESMVPAIEKMLPKLDSILASLNVILADPAIPHSLHNIEHITNNLTVTSSQLNVLMGGLNRGVPQMMSKANDVLDNTNRLTKKLNDVDVAETMAKVNATLDNVHELTNKLNSNEGTLGLLMRDPSLYNNLNATMTHADSLVSDLKAHPKRYVHFSVFGKKDK